MPLPPDRPMRNSACVLRCEAAALAAMLKQALSPVIDLVYPPRCPACGAAIANHGALCQDCWSALVIPGEPACTACQRPFNHDDTPDGSICAPCLADPPLHDGVSAATLYTDGARKLVLAFKHGHRIALAGLLARQMLARLPLLDGEWLVVPVPLHRLRLWKRGFNQSALLAGEIARARGHALLVDGLVRTKATPPLGELGRKQRAEVLKGAIAVNPRRAEQLKGAQVLLVDDVMTSGATTTACLKVLRKAGAAKVRIACFSRVLDEAL